MATTGNNSNNGSSSRPYKTIQYAIDNTTAGDTIYVADSESEFDEVRNPGWQAGIRVGSLLTGKVDYFIDGMVEAYPEGSNPEGVAVDAYGNVYGAVVSGGGAMVKSYRP